MSSAMLSYSNSLVSLHKGTAFCSVRNSAAFPNVRKSNVPVLFSVRNLATFPNLNKSKVKLNLERVRRAPTILKISYVAMLTLTRAGGPSSASCLLWVLWRALEKIAIASKPVVERYRIFILFLANVAGVVDSIVKLINHNKDKKKEQ